MHKHICKHCKKEFFNKNKEASFCCHKCSNINTAIKRKKRSQVEFRCDVCGKVVKMSKSKLNDRTGRFCSIKCARASKIKKRVKLKCSFCGKDVFKLKSRIKQFNFCNNNCRRSYFKKNPPNKKNGFWFENGYKVLYNKGNQIKEHIFVIEKAIGRKLNKNEVVHHINGIIDDNRLENLRLMTRSEHTSLHRNG